MAGLTKQQINDLYTGIIAPQGGLYQPGPPVMMPPQGMGNAGNTQAMAQALMQSTSSPFDVQNDPSMPVSGGFQPGTWADQQRLPSSDPAYGSGQGVDPQLAYTMGTPGANQGTGPLQGNEATKQIAKILIQGGAAPPGPRSDPRETMPWEPAVSQGPSPSGDPWQKLRISAPTQQPGMMTTNRPPRGLGAIGNPAVYSQPTKPAITTYQAALQQAAQQHNTTPEAIHQQLMAQQSPDQRGQAALNAAGMGPGQGGNSGGANGVGSW